jgi:hypothetical protein
MKHIALVLAGLVAFACICSAQEAPRPPGSSIFDTDNAAQKPPTTAPADTPHGGTAGSPSAADLAMNSAMQRFDEANAKAAAEQKKAIGDALQSKVADLEAARQMALKAGQSADAARIESVEKQAESELAALQSGNPAAAASQPVASGNSGKLLLAIKGEAEIYLNGQQIGTADQTTPAILPLSLQKGDLIVLHVRSEFVHRSLALAFIPDNGEGHQLPPKFLSSDASPEKITARDAIDAPPAANGKRDEAVAGALRSAGITEPMEPIALEEKNKWMTFAWVMQDSDPFSARK